MKQINDQLGHDTGDLAIRAVAQVLQSVFRSSDVVSRLGGDEFAVFAADCDEQGVAAACARLERAVEELNAQGASSYRLSISAGAAVRSADSELDLAGLVQAADSKMYEIKRARRGAPALRVMTG